MKKLYHIKIAAENYDIYSILKEKEMEVESVCILVNKMKIISVIVDSEDMLALKLCVDCMIIDDDTTLAGGLQTPIKLWAEHTKTWFNKIIS